MPIQKCVFFFSKNIFLFFCLWMMRRVFGEMMNHNKWWLIHFPPTKLFFKTPHKWELYNLLLFENTYRTKFKIISIFHGHFFSIFLFCRYRMEIWVRSDCILIFKMGFWLNERLKVDTSSAAKSLFFSKTPLTQFQI